MLPVNLEPSVPPSVSSPLTDSKEVVGSKETPMRFWGMVPELKRLSVTVGTEFTPLTVSSVRSTGPMLVFIGE